MYIYNAILGIISPLYQQKKLVCVNAVKKNVRKLWKHYHVVFLLLFE